MLRQVFTVAAVVVLIAGCSDGNKPVSKTGDGQPSATTPTAPTLTAYDPPKAFTATAALPQGTVPKHPTFKPKAGMVGQTVVVADLRGLYGQNVANQGAPWQLPSTEVTTVETLDATAPMSVRLNGKDAIAVAYYQRVQGSGTNKAKVQVVFQWADPTDGKAMAAATINVTPTIGEDELTAGLSASFTSETVDAATGQVAVGLSPLSLMGAKSGIFTVFGDPATKKTATLPFVEPAGVANGIVVGAKGRELNSRSLAVVDATTGAVKKTGLTGLDALHPAGFGPKHAYLSAEKYIPATKNEILGHYVNSIYAIDPATGAAVQTLSVVKDAQEALFTCWGDSKNSVVCTSHARGQAEIIGIDDTTGKKTWGYTEKSGSRVVPKITAAFHGLVYAQAEAGPALLDATTGHDVPSPTPTPAGNATPTDGSTPTAGSTPSDGSTPTIGLTPTDNDSPGAVLDAKPASPDAVSAYGGAYLKEPDAGDSTVSAVLMILKAVG
jgi:hypothetical protein